MNKPRFNGTPVASLDSLSAMLGIERKRLDWIVKSVSMSYKQFKVETGKNKKERQIFEPKRSLKGIQKKINKEIFEKIDYPHYLHGALSGRDYISNAAVHTRKRTVICLDITNFYPSISKKDVCSIFKNLMRFSPDVSLCLTELVTLNNKVPQGGCCSSYIANLLFFNSEYNIYNRLKSMGLSYSRLLDDITISSDKDLSSEEKTKVIKLVHGMVNQYRLSINESKTTIEHSKNSSSKLSVTGLWVKHGVPKLTKENRRYIRYLVYICKKQGAYERHTKEYHDLWNRCSGKVAQMSRLGHVQAVELRAILSEIMPVYDDYKISKLKLMAKHYLNKFTPPLTDDQIRKIDRMLYDFDIVGRTNKNLAKLYRRKLVALLPDR
ncbi:putative retron-type reverse transcriptase [Escherichia coli]|uniref:reverse transcriptase family protein n=1 Tax=Escherichia coli TaxID=562 RepID=UPI0006A20E17|nr:reverse transcriptase family protein [Escherichia coli]CTW90365.1 putative retron-type reverse transcriptase [Escherichia coli]CTX09317.1 putative retron-type reverse transcriptase [Escherichia coli]